MKASSSIQATFHGIDQCQYIFRSVQISRSNNTYFNIYVLIVLLELHGYFQAEKAIKLDKIISCEKQVTKNLAKPT